MEFSDLMKEFGAKVGIPDLRPGADGVCSLSVDGLELVLAEKPDTDELVLMAEVGDIPQEGRDQFFRKLLEEMDGSEQTNGAVYSVEPKTKKVFLHQTARLLLLDAEKLMTMLPAFAEVLRRARSFAADFRASMTEMEIGKFTSGMGSNAFIQV